MLKEHRATAAVVCGIVILVGIAMVLSDRNREREYTEAHEATVEAESHAAKVDTAAIIATALAKQARVAVTPARAPLVKWAHDTVTVPPDTIRAEVLRYVARVDTALVKDSLAIAACGCALDAQKAVSNALRSELAAALNRPAPRTTVTLEALYDPLHGVPAIGGTVTLRVAGRVGLLARADQRLAIGEKIGGYVGFSLKL